jgi:hypothetical protein
MRDLNDYRPSRVGNSYWTDEHAMRMYGDPAYRYQQTTGLDREGLQGLADQGGVAYVGPGMRPVDVYETALEAPDTAFGGMTAGEYFGVRRRTPGAAERQAPSFSQFDALLRR